MENPNAVQASSELNLEVARVRDATSAKIIETTGNEVELGIVYMGQFAKNLRTACADLGLKNKRHQDKVNRAAKDELEKKALALKAKKEEEDAEAKKLMQRSKVAKCFCVQWSGIGSDIEVIKGDTASATRVRSDQDSTFCARWIVEDSARLTAACAHATVTATMQSWADKFPARAASALTGQVAAPFRAVHGCVEF